jgi:hypothetical protein
MNDEGEGEEEEEPGKKEGRISTMGEKCGRFEGKQNVRERDDQRSPFLQFPFFGLFRRAVAEMSEIGAENGKKKKKEKR